MSSEIAIDLQQLGKCYHIYRNPRDRLLQGLWRGKRKLYREFWALRDVSFQVHKGETVGIIGRNGSGKSTLLQLLCGTLTPSVGTYQVHGRVAALLELGAGFNPEFTGRENVLMKSTILGLSREESKARYQSIEDFADIGDFIDQPVKTYSSGMYVRLAFAVAINVDPAILVVDEALAVGDEAFRRKCYSRIEQIRQQGATVLFVSHSAQAIVQLCNRAILMEGGEYLLSGEPKQVVGEYQKLLYAPKEKAPALRQRLREHPHRFNYEGDLDDGSSLNATAQGDAPQEGLRADYDPNMRSQSTIYYEQHGAKIEDPHLEDLDGQRVNVLLNRHMYVYTFKVTFTEDAYNVRFGMGIKTTAGYQLGGAQSYRRGDYDPIATVNAGETLQVRFRMRCMMVPGTYFLNCAVQGVQAGEEVALDRQIDAVMFRVVQNGRTFDHGPSDFLLSASILGRDSVEEPSALDEDAAELPV